MYIRDSMDQPFLRKQRSGLSVMPIAPSRFTHTLGEPPVPSAPRLTSKPGKISNKLYVEMPAPPLIASKDNTLYVEIPLGIDEAENRNGKSFKIKPLTGIFVPDGYLPGYVINLILYLHGYTTDYPGDGVAIDGYWDAAKFPFFGLREGIKDSGRKDVILVAPTLGPKSQAGALTLWPDAYLDQVMLALMAHGPYKTGSYGPLYANIILASHSGGGSPMRKIALSKNRYTANLLECWGFDSLNGDNTETKEWIEWAKSNPTKNLYIHYCDYVDRDPKKSCISTKAQSESLKRHRETPTNVKVEKSTAKNHFWLPLAHWKDRLQKTVFPPRP